MYIQIAFNHWIHSILTFITRLFWDQIIYSWIIYIPLSFAFAIMKRWTPQ